MSLLRKSTGTGEPERGQVRQRKIDLELARDRIPGTAAVAHQDSFALGNDPDLTQRPSAGELASQPAQGAADSLRRNLGLDQLPGGAKENQILEGEAVPILRTALGSEEPCPRLGSHLNLGPAQQPGHIPSGEGFHEPTI